MEKLKNKRFFSSYFGEEVFINANGEIIANNFVIGRLEKVSSNAIISFFEDLIECGRLVMK